MKLLISVLFLTLPLLAEDKPVPTYPQRTAETLYTQIGQCNADLSDMRKYTQSLAEALSERDKEIASLKAELATK